MADNFDPEAFVVSKGIGTNTPRKSDAAASTSSGFDPAAWAESKKQDRTDRQQTASIAADKNPEKLEQDTSGQHQLFGIPGLNYGGTKSPSDIASYKGVPDSDLNPVQKLEKKALEMGLRHPGEEIYSPAAMKAKAQGAATMTNAATFGYLPQINGGLADITGGNYLKTRDETAKYLSEVPWQIKAPGTIIGGGASTIMASPLLNAIKPASTLSMWGRALNSAVQGGVMAGAVNPRDTKGVIDPLQAVERGKNAAIGAGAAGLNSLGTEGVVKNALLKPLTSKAGIGSAGTVLGYAVYDTLKSAINKEGVDPATVMKELGAVAGGKLIKPAGAAALGVILNKLNPAMIGNTVGLLDNYQNQSKEQNSVDRRMKKIKK